jgi:hypothetical protein
MQARNSLPVRSFSFSFKALSAAVVSLTLLSLEVYVVVMLGEVVR